VTEIQKYQGIYTSPSYAFYGHSNHGARAVSFVEKRLHECQSKAILDVGCGWNEFIHQWRESHPDTNATGIDFACPGADIQAPAHALPLADQAIGVLTAFDMLEHLTPTEVQPCLAEFARVSEAFVFSISHVPSKVTWRGQNLHPTVQSKDWWIAQIIAAGGRNLKENSGYLSGQWGNPVLKLKPDSRVILVGNGPSLLAQSQGPIIDTFDEVIRFNRYRLNGFEPFTGTRTTLWSNFGHGYLPGDDTERPNRMIFVYGERGHPAYPANELYRIPKLFYHTQQQKVRAASTHPAEHAAKLGMSSGYVVAQWLLDVVGLPQITLAGFDHFRKHASSLHHYYNPKSYGRPPELDGEAEARIFANLAAAGQVIYL
jgi:hypothetical protein